MKLIPCRSRLITFIERHILFIVGLLFGSLSICSCFSTLISYQRRHLSFYLLWLYRSRLFVIFIFLNIHYLWSFQRWIWTAYFRAFFLHNLNRFLVLELPKYILQIRFLSLIKLFLIYLIFTFKTLSNLSVNFLEILNSLLYLQSFKPGLRITFVALWRDVVFWSLVLYLLNRR